MEYLHGRKIRWRRHNPEGTAMDYEFFVALLDAEYVTIETAPQRDHYLIRAGDKRMPLPLFDKLLSLDDQTRMAFIESRWDVYVIPRVRLMVQTNNGSTKSLKAWGKLGSYLWHIYVRNNAADPARSAASLWIRKEATECVHDVVYGLRDGNVVLEGKIPDDFCNEVDIDLISITPDDTLEEMYQKEDAYFFMILFLLETLATGSVEDVLETCWPTVLNDE